MHFRHFTEYIRFTTLGSGWPIKEVVKRSPGLHLRGRTKVENLKMRGRVRDRMDSPLPTGEKVQNAPNSLLPQ